MKHGWNKWKTGIKTLFALLALWLVVAQLAQEGSLVNLDQLQAGNDVQTMSSIGSAGGQLFPLILLVVLSISIYSDLSGKRISLFGRKKRVNNDK